MVSRNTLKKYNFLLPVIVLLVIITIFPLLYSLCVSLTNLRLTALEKPEFVGLKNYYEILVHDKRFWRSLYNTFTIAIPALALETILGLGIALLLNREIRGKRLITVLLILPVVIPPLTSGLIWRMLYHEKYGPINGLLSYFGITRQITWLSTPGLTKFAVILTDVWQWTPFMMMMILAGLQAVPVECIEAAEVDGASPVQRFFYITLPMLKYTLMVAALLRIMDLIKLFDVVFVLTMGGPGGTTETISMYTYLVSFRAFRMGFGSALSYLVLIITVILCTYFIRLIKGKS
jgi:multiple sugar transport system permease protein